MRTTPEFEDFIRIYTSAGESIIPLSQVRAVLRKSPHVHRFEEACPAGPVPNAPAVGVELRSGEILWSAGENDWYYSGEPSRLRR